MTQLATPHPSQMHGRGNTQTQPAVHTGVSQGTISAIRQNDHIPQIETLFRLADHFGTDRIEILFIAGHLQTAGEVPRGQHAQPVLSPAPSEVEGEAEGPDKADHLVRELIEELRRVPDEWRHEVI